MITQNGLVDLNNHIFRLLYSRRDNDGLVARIVAEQDGVIRAKIEPEADGRDQGEAFRALRKHVEMKLDKILMQVPDGNPSDLAARAGPSSPRVVGTQHPFILDAPPEYGSGDVKLGGKRR